MNLTPGQKVVWKHIPRGGYGYVIPVPAEVVRVWVARVTIRVQKASGEYVNRVVKPESLVVPPPITA